MSHLRTVGAVKYNIGDSIPAHLQLVGVVEVSEGDPIPANTVQYDLTYYSFVDDIPVNRLPLAAHAFASVSLVPSWIKRIVATVLALIVLTDGKSLKFDTADNSAHIATVGA